jgi:crotonobetainyl-CoA hydratase
VLSRAGGPLEIALATRYESMEAYASTEDVEEGKRAFAERRAAIWKGR